MRWPLLAIFALVAACGASPRGPHPQQVPRHAWLDEDPETGEELICDDERQTGTNLSQPVCRTQEEIDMYRNAALRWEKLPRNNLGR